MRNITVPCRTRAELEAQCLAHVRAHVAASLTNGDRVTEGAIREVATVPLVESAVVVDGLPRVVAVITFQKDAHAYLYCRDAAQAKAIAALLSSARVAKTGEGE